MDYADALFDEACDIADNTEGDIVMLPDKSGNLFPQVQHNVIQRDKLCVDTRMKIATKINPAKYGERLELAGDVAEARGMDDEKLLAGVAGILGRLGVEAVALQCLVKLTPFVITKLAESNIRTGNSTEDPIVFTAEKGVLLQVQQEKNGWLRVKHSDGDEGWISAKIVFGWQDVDDSRS